MHFTKMHGAGNDFVIVNNLDGKISRENYPMIAKKLCAYHTGIGADGMMFVMPPEQAGDFKMLFFNNDGTEGEMCGNGARCIARYGHDNGLSGDKQTIETISGIIHGTRVTEDLYRIRLNDASIAETSRPATVNGKKYDTGYIELGTPGLPHAVLEYPGWREVPVSQLRDLGKNLRFAKEFPKGANVSFAEVLDRNNVVAVTFERGVEDFTLACGTGCGSIVSLLTMRGKVCGKNVKVSMPGGDLFVTADCGNPLPSNICLTGPTCVSFTGDTNL